MKKKRKSIEEIVSEHQARVGKGKNAEIQRLKQEVERLKKRINDLEEWKNLCQSG